MIETSPDGKMRTLTTVLPESEEPAKYKTLSGFMPSGNLVKSAQSPPGPMPFDTSHLTKTVRLMRRAWQWVVSDSHRFTQPVSCSSWDTDYCSASYVAENATLLLIALPRPMAYTEPSGSSFAMPTP